MIKPTKRPVFSVHKDFTWNLNRDEHGPYYLMETGNIAFAVLYKVDTHVQSTRLYPDRYFRVAGYSLVIDLRYDFPVTDPTTGTCTQKQVTTMHTNDRSPQLWYLLVPYDRETHEILDDDVIIRATKIENDPDWARYEQKGES